MYALRSCTTNQAHPEAPPASRVSSQDCYPSSRLHRTLYHPPLPPLSARRVCNCTTFLKSHPHCLLTSSPLASMTLLSLLTSMHSAPLKLLCPLYAILLPSVCHPPSCNAALKATFTLRIAQPRTVAFFDKSRGVLTVQCKILGSKALRRRVVFICSG